MILQDKKKLLQKEGNKVMMLEAQDVVLFNIISKDSIFMFFS